MIIVKKANTSLEDFNLNGSIIQNPYKAFMPYWKGDTSSFFEYIKSNELEYNFRAENIFELNKKCNEFLSNLSNTIKKNIGQFDPRIINSLGQRNLVDVTENDYLKITFQKENNLPFSDEEIQTFLNNPSRSFLDLRQYSAEKNELTLIYNRRGIYDEGSRIAVLKSKDTLTFRENFKDAKDNNFILSGFVYEFANLGEDFKYSFFVGEDERENIITAEEILNAKDERLDRNEAIITQKAAQDIASSEIRKEKQERRQSLGYDSTSGEILAEASTEIRINPVKENIETINENINNSINSNQNNSINNSNNVNKTKEALEQMVEQAIDFYEQKEIEKMRIRLNNARTDAKLAYEDMMYKIRNGSSALEALNFAKQKYSEEHTINMASAFLSKDILEVDIKNNEITTLRSKISELDNNNTLLNEEITKREQAITSLKSTMQQKVNEINLLKEKHEEDLIAVTNALKEEALKQVAEYENKLEGIQSSFREIIAKKDEELAQQDEAIFKFNALNENLNLRLSDVEEKADKLIKQNGILEQSNLNFKEQVEKLEKENSVIKNNNLELEKKINELIKQNGILEQSNLNFKEQVEKLEKENSVIKNNNLELEKTNSELVKKVEDFVKLNKNYTDVKKDDEKVKKYDEKVKKDDEKVKKYDTISDKENVSQEDLLNMLSNEEISNRQKLEIIQQIDIMKAIDSNGQILEDKKEDKKNDNVRSFKRQQ